MAPSIEQATLLPPQGPQDKTDTRAQARGFTFKLGEDIAVLGGKGSGKTVFLHHVYNEAPRAVFFNILGEAGVHILSDAFVVCDTTTADNLRRAIAARNPDGTPRYRKIEVLVNQDIVIELDALRLLYEDTIAACMEVGNICLINDELAAVTQGEWHSNALRHITLYGRHRNVSHVFAGQRNQLLPKDSITMAAHTVVYAISMYDSASYTAWMRFDLNAALKDAPKGSFKYLWLREYNWTVEKPVPLLMDEQTGVAYVPVKNPERVD